MNNKIKKIVLAGGCFWGMEELIRKQPGVLDTVVGYTGGKAENPTYENHEGHAEAVEIAYDPAVTTYRKLLDFFFQIHNPTTLNRQGNDIGDSYRSAIFYGNEDERKEAEDLIGIVNASKRWPDPVVTSLEPLAKFYPAEDYHQNYFARNPMESYCRFVVAPKAAKLRKVFAVRLGRDGCHRELLEGGQLPFHLAEQRLMTIEPVKIEQGA